MEVKIPLSLYVVRTDLITEEEFVTLDRHFRKGMLDLRSGENAKGVVFRTDFELTEMDIAKFSDTQMERLGKTQPEPVTAKGNVMAARRPSNKLFLSVDLSISKGAMEAKGDTPRELNIVGDAAFSEEGVVVFAGGELRAFKEQPPAYPGTPRGDGLRPREQGLHLGRALMPSAEPNIVIRPAVPGDEHALCELVRELAEYEKALG
jgi:hypothetical protein